MSLSRNDKIPYGTWVLDKLLPRFLHQESFIINTKSLAEVLPQLHQDSLLNLIILGNEFDPDPYEIKSLIRFVENGNTILLSAYQFGGSFSDSLKFVIDFSYFHSSSNNRDGTALCLTDGNFKGKEYNFNKMFFSSFFSELDSSKTTILGTDGKGRVNFFFLRIGNGRIFVHSQPAAFTNFHLLYGDPSYAAAVFSYLPKQVSIWDEYYKPRQFRMNSLLNFVLKDSSLRAAYYLVLALVLIFFLTESKRRQRVIPVVQNLKNTSADFAHVLGNLYYQKRDHAGLAIKKYKLFIEDMRSKYLLPAGLPNESWMDILANKSKIERNELDILVRKIKQIENKGKMTEQELISFSSFLDCIQEKSKI